MLAAVLLTAILGADEAPTDRYTAWFRSHDQNEDGAITSDEFSRPRFFKRLDLDGDGRITWLEGLEAADTHGRAARPPLGAPDGTRVHSDLAYGEHALQRLDLYVPQSPGPHPLLIMIHGGGWRLGDKSNRNCGFDKAAFAAREGWALASVNYRLSPEVTHPEHVNDVAAAIAWLHDHAGAFGVDPGTTVVMGHSAGAHLAALVSTDPRRLAAHGKRLDMLSGAILLDGAGYDIPGLLDAPGGESTLPEIYRAAFTDDPDVQADASPALRVAAGTAIPPFLICHTTRQASSAQSRTLAAAITQAGGLAEVLPAPGDTHAAINHRIGEASHRPTQAIAAFLAPHHPWPNMTWVPAGEVTIGAAPRTMPTQRHATRIHVGGFWIDDTEVTNDQFAAFVEATGYVTTAERPVDWAELAAQLPPGTPKPPEDQLVPGSAVFTPPPAPTDLRDFHGWWTWTPGADWRHPQGPGSDTQGRGEHPVVHVSWHDAVAYAAWAGKRLPTENEWERAARFDRDGAAFTWGDDRQPDGRFMANIWQGPFPHGSTAEDGFEATAPVRSFPPNELGLSDMSGNVWEWTADRHGPHDRVQKGGSFLCHDSYCGAYRPSARATSTPDSTFPHVGFRCVRDGVTPDNRPSAPEQ